MSLKKFILSLLFAVELLIIFPLLILMMIPIQPKLRVAFDSAVIHDLLAIHWNFTNYVSFMIFGFLFVLIKIFELSYKFKTHKSIARLINKCNLTAFVFSIIVGMLCTQSKSQFELSAGLISFILIFAKLIPNSFKQAFTSTCTNLFYYWISEENNDEK